MVKDKRYYWLKLKEDFFEDDTIQWIEEQENGKEYALFYLKLCLKSLAMDGRVTRIVGSKVIPYDKRTLAKITNTEPDTVAVALHLFNEIGLIELLETGEIYMNQLNEMVGSETAEAVRKRRQRANLQNNKTEQIESGGQEGDNVPPVSHESPMDVAQSIEYREKSLESRGERVEVKKTHSPTQAQIDFGTIIRSYEQNISFHIGERQRDMIHCWLEEFENVPLILYAIDRAHEKNPEKPQPKFVEYLLKNWQSESITDPAEAKIFEAQREKVPARKTAGTNWDEID